MYQQQHSSIRINIKKAFIIVSMCKISVLQLCNVMSAFQKKENGGGTGNYSFNLWGYISEEEWGYLPISAGMRRSLVCVFPSDY